MAVNTPPPTPADSAPREKKKGKRWLIIVVIIIIGVIILVAAFWPGSPPPVGSGTVSVQGITIQWNGQTYPLLTQPYSSAQSSGGYGSAGFTFNAEFTAGGQCPGGASSCFSPASTFAVTSLTSGFKVSWVTACFQSKGASSLIGGPIYYKYSSSPPAVPFGCSSYGNEVDMTGITPASVVTLTVGVQFPSSGYSGTLALLATPTSLNSTSNNGEYHQTAMGLSCTPDPVEIQGGAICTATVNDTTTTPTPPTGQVQFGTGANLGATNLGSCTLASSSTSDNASSACAIVFDPQANGETTVSASYAGDSGHQGGFASTDISVYSISISIVPTSQTVTQGQSATYTVTVTLGNGSLPGGIPPIVLSASACSNYFTCTFSSASLTPTLSGNSTTLTVDTSQTSVQLPASITFAVTGLPANAENTSMTPISSNNAAITVQS